MLFTTALLKIIQRQGSHSDWENGMAFSSQGKVRDNNTKYWKNLGISDKCYLSFLVIFK